MSLYRQCRPLHAGQRDGFENHSIIGTQLAGPSGGSRQGSVLLGIGASLAITVTPRHGIADLGEGVIKNLGRLSGKALAAVPREVGVDAGAELDLGNIGQAVEGRATPCRGGHAGQHRLEERSFEGSRIIIVRKDAIPEALGGQPACQARRNAAEGQARIQFAVGKVKPGLHACVGPVGGCDDLNDAISALKGAPLQSGRRTFITGLNAHGRFRY
jgi:hypothetical protein